MPELRELQTEELSQYLSAAKAEYEQFKAKNLKLDMSRGKPGSDQLNLSEGMLDALKGGDCIDGGTDCRNYAPLDGLMSCRKLFSEILGIPAENIIAGGNSSLQMMYDAIMRAYVFGVLPGMTPWGKLSKVKFLCPSPGYDRHFAITEHFGFELVTVPMTEHGPDMDIVEELVRDESVKGMWCTPRYSNPTGITFSDETVRRMARLKAAEDFRIIWDDAYIVHDLYDEPDVLLNLYDEAHKAGNPDIFYTFMSTSKITFPGGGVAAFAASDKNVDWARKQMFFQTIGSDKLNQLRHVRFLRDMDNLREHMKKQAAVLRPKFEIVSEALTRNLGGLGVARWNNPRGGYFMSLDVIEGCATRVVSLAREAGVVFTPEGSTYPYKNDPKDENIRIAPTFPPENDLRVSMELFCVCVRLAAAEKLLAAKK